jgi:phage tail sheath gpL-like
MTVQTNIPSVLPPFISFTFSTKGGVFEQQSKAVIIGQKLSVGTATTGSLVVVPTGAEDALFGKGSMLSYMVKTFKKNSPTKTPYVIPLADPSGVKASCTITVSTATATVSEDLILNIHGERMNISVIAGQTNATIASNIASAINNYLNKSKNGRDLLVIASASTNVVTVTARHFGTMFNGLVVRIDNPKTLGVTITAMANGTGTISTTGVLDVIPEGGNYDWIANPYTDSTSLTNNYNYTNNTNGTWSPFSQSYGHIFSFVMDTLANLGTLGDTLNNQHLSVMGNKNSVTAGFAVASAMVSYAIDRLTTAPDLSKPEQSFVLEGIEFDTAFSFADRNTLYEDGIGSFTMSADGKVYYNRILTTYKTNQYGVLDNTYRDIQTMAQLQYSARFLRSEIASNHPDDYLDNERFEAVKETIRHALQKLENLKVIEDAKDIFSKAIIERSTLDANRIDVQFVDYNHTNQMRQFAHNIQSVL